PRLGATSSCSWTPTLRWPRTRSRECCARSPRTPASAPSSAPTTAAGGCDADPAWRSIEDVELGYRLRRAHHRIRLDRTLQGTHLKRWTLGSMIRTDALYRAAPWARLMRRDGAPPSDLNLRTDQRLSVALAVAAVVSLPLGLVDPTLLAPAMLCRAGGAALNRHLLAFLHAQGGMAFALACFPLHVVHYLSGAAGFVYGWLDGRRGA